MLNNRDSAFTWVNEVQANGSAEVMLNRSVHKSNEKATRSVIQKSKDGVLFVEKAYILTPGDSKKDYGKCAVEERMREMEIHDPVMIFAGYPRARDETIF